MDDNGGRWSLGHLRPEPVRSEPPRPAGGRRNPAPDPRGKVVAVPFSAAASRAAGPPRGATWGGCAFAVLLGAALAATVGVLLAG